MKRDSFIFYRSFYEAIKELPREVRGDVLTAIMEYGLNGETTEQLKPIAKAIITLIKPQLDANNKRYENGKKGGRPKGSEKPNNNQTETKQQPCNNQIETEQKPNNNQAETTSKPNVNVNDNVNDNDKEIPPLPPKGDFVEAEISNDKPNHRKTPTKRKKVAQKKEKFDLSFVATPYKAIVLNFIDYRKELKKPFKTERGVEAFYDKLIKLSGNNMSKATQLAEYAKDREWQTVYEIKNETHGNTEETPVVGRQTRQTIERNSRGW